MIDIYTDGATIGHNGKLGTVSEVTVGVHIPELNIERSKRMKGISNNEAEFRALIFGMEMAIINEIKEARFHSDSQIIINRANGSRPRGKYANMRMDKFQDEVLTLAKMFDTVKFVWIPREQNMKADELSKQ